MITTLPEDASPLAVLLHKIQIFARRHYKYPYPKEPFFQDIAVQTISDAHGIAEKPSLTKIRVKTLWLFVKSKSLRYLLGVRTELQNRFMARGQRAYYAHKLDSKIDDVEVKVECLIDQFSDTEDIRD